MGTSFEYSKIMVKRETKIMSSSFAPSSDQHGQARLAEGDVKAQQGF